MLLRLVRYPYGAVRARALAGRFRDPGMLRGLAAEEGGRALREVLFSGGEEEKGHDLLRLEREYRRVAMTLARCLPRRGAALIRSYLERLAVENLKLVCRKILLDRPDLSPSELLTPGGQAGFPPPERLRDVETLEELERLVPKGPLRKILRRGEGEGTVRRLFLLETSLERYFWDNLASRINRLSPLDRLTAGELFGLRADLDRFRIVVRAWREGGEARKEPAFLPALGSVFAPENVRRALRSDDPQAALSRLHPVAGLDSPLSVEGEQALVGRLRRQLRSALREAPVGLGPSLAALLLKELEVEDVRGVLGGLALGSGVDQIDAWLAARSG